MDLEHGSVGLLVHKRLQCAASGGRSMAVPTRRPWDKASVLTRWLLQRVFRLVSDVLWNTLATFTWGRFWGGFESTLDRLGLVWFGLACWFGWFVGWFGGLGRMGPTVGSRRARTTQQHAAALAVDGGWPWL